MQCHHVNAKQKDHISLKSIRKACQDCLPSHSHALGSWKSSWAPCKSGKCGSVGTGRITGILSHLCVARRASGVKEAPRLPPPPCLLRLDLQRNPHYKALDLIITNRWMPEDIRQCTFSEPFPEFPQLVRYKHTHTNSRACKHIKLSASCFFSSLCPFPPSDLSKLE